MKKKPERQQTANMKASILVLVVASVIFLAAVLWIHSKDFLNGIDEHFNAYGDGIVEFEKGTVLDILSEDMEPEEAADNAWRGNQKL